MKNYAHAIKNAIKICDAWLPHKIQYDRVPGLAVGIMYKGRLVYQRGFGFADVERKIPITPETCFRIASVSKTFTAVAIMQLVEQRKLNLTDPVNKYLPWFKIRGSNDYLRDITISQLLSHTAGVFRDGDTGHWETDEFPNSERLRKAISKKTAVFGLVTEFKYSNFGYAILGEVIEKASGLSYTEYLNIHIIQKLSLTKTYPDFTPEVEKLLAQGYSRKIPNQERELFKHSKSKSYSAATGIISNIQDLAKFFSSFSLGNDEQISLLKMKSKRKMMERHWDTEEETGSYGLGFHIESIDGRSVVYHGGGYIGFTSEVTMDVNNDIVVVTLSNTNDVSCSFINRGVLETIYEFADHEHRYKDGHGISERENFEGVYRSRYRDTIVIGIDDKLVTILPQDDSPLKQSALMTFVRNNTFSLRSETVFDSPGELITFVFKKDDEKAVKMLVGASPAQRIKND